MKKIIHEIRRQPQHVRELATILCTIAVVAVVGLIWFRSFQKDIYALLNTSDRQEDQDRLFATESKSIFSSMMDSLGNSKAQISELFNSNSGTSVKNPSASATSTATPQAPHPLPLSGSR